jgi:hypothetical protein
MIQNFCLIIILVTIILEASFIKFSVNLQLLMIIRHSMPHLYTPHLLPIFHLSFQQIQQ